MAGRQRLKRSGLSLDEGDGDPQSPDDRIDVPPPVREHTSDDGTDDDTASPPTAPSGEAIYDLAGSSGGVQPPDEFAEEEQAEEEPLYDVASKKITYLEVMPATGNNPFFAMSIADSTNDDTNI